MHPRRAITHPRGSSFFSTERLGLTGGRFLSRAFPPPPEEAGKLSFLCTPEERSLIHVDIFFVLNKIPYRSETSGQCVCQETLDEASIVDLNRDCHLIYYRMCVSGRLGGAWRRVEGVGVCAAHKYILCK